MLAGDVGTGNVTGLCVELTVHRDVKRRAEPVQGRIFRREVHGLVTNRASSAVDGLCPGEVGRSEVIRREGEGQAGPVERGIELDRVFARKVPGFIAEAHVEVDAGGDGVVKLELDHPRLCKIPEIDRDRRGGHTVDHAAGVEGLAGEAAAL